MKEEDKIFAKLGKGNPFEIPDGYFESLTSKVMGSLPEKEIPNRMKELTKWERFKPYVYLAAVFVGAAIIIKVLNVQMVDDPTFAANETAKYETEVINNVMNSTLMDDYSLYEYLADAE